MTNFNIKLYCVLLSTDIPNNKQYVLSLSPEAIDIPYFELTQDMLSNIETNLIAKMKELIFVNDIELMPQLIALHSNDFDTNTDNNSLNAVYGFLVKYTHNINIDKVSWKEFKYLEPNKYSNLIMRVIQNLK